MEDYTKAQKVENETKPWEPILLPFQFPEKYKDEEMFTVENIMECVETFFDFRIARKSTGKRNSFSCGQAAVRKYISRQLSEGAYQQAPKSRSDRKKYPRKIVEKLFNNYEFQVHFLKVSIEQKKRQLESLERETNPVTDPKKANPQQKTASQKENSEKIAQAKDNLKKAKNRLKQLEGSPELRSTYIKDCIASFDRDTLDRDNDIETKSMLWLEKAKERILFQFLFESLINLREDLLYEDIKQLLSIDDEFSASDRQIWAALNFKNLHNYYDGKIDLAECLKKLCRALEKF